MNYDEHQVVDILRAVRHDLLNQIQLLKVNASLKRLDRVERIIDEIVYKAKAEAKLTNLQVPKTTLFLLGYNWQPKPFKLKTEVNGGPADWSKMDSDLYFLIKDVFEVFEANSDDMTNNVMIVSIEIDELEPKISFQYQGKIKDDNSLNQYFIKLNQTYHLVEKYIHNKDTVITIDLTEALR
ncbi:MAG: Spo0B C-terminal domain-containing protein [Tuberibacillus sp.]